MANVKELESFLKALEEYKQEAERTGHPLKRRLAVDVIDAVTFLLTPAKNLTEQNKKIDEFLTKLTFYRDTIREPGRGVTYVNNAIGFLEKQKDENKHQLGEKSILSQLNEWKEKYKKHEGFVERLILIAKTIDDPSMSGEKHKENLAVVLSGLLGGIKMSREDEADKGLSKILLAMRNVISSKVPVVVSPPIEQPINQVGIFAASAHAAAHLAIPEPKIDTVDELLKEIAKFKGALNASSGSYHQAAVELEGIFSKLKESTSPTKASYEAILKDIKLFRNYLSAGEGSKLLNKCQDFVNKEIKKIEAAAEVRYQGPRH